MVKDWSFPPDQEQDQGAFSPPLLKIVLENLPRAVKKKIKDWKERSKTTFAGEMILYVENPKESTKIIGKAKIKFKFTG